ncbi:MBL fold metallo-hydrolase [Rhizorhapis suberifaciens]|uniref:Glyoxylase-like metal-dependent hydrolase (Beta-lactamase superfamily II) n=1 Tax=Rhizorhapis suberifaciens TaxID=13656 RepID=A0A840HQH6_9SPHN|nr:MBL fold metallo-hydrolase [Rhizorhapis suberifaciens]MBB4640185.1 glyoxylase-like metal-dependent hydrolase (beta-lactamase superfamily II) [Rhizorhapis suberifaciens]
MQDSNTTTPAAAHAPTTKLGWQTFVTPGVPTVSDDIPPGETARWWSPITSILIYGDKDAVLIDTPTTVAQATAVTDWVVASGKNLTTIYITHGHGDHFFGTGTVQERFPDARAIAASDVVDRMRDQIAPAMMEGMWNKRFPGLIPDNIVIADPLAETSFFLEGHELRVVPTGHSDTDDTTCLYVPSLDLVVAGDVVYNDVHQYLSESTTREKRLEWIAALDTIDALKPKVVIAGHKRPENGDGPETIEETRQYLRDFDRLVDETASTSELYRAMLALYPNRVNPGALWGSARAVKGF